MSQKETKVFISNSQVKEEELTDQQRKFATIPLCVFRDYTNIRSIIIKNYKKQHGKNPYEFIIKKKTENYHRQLSSVDDWDDSIFDQLEFTGCPKHQQVYANEFTHSLDFFNLK